MATRKAEQYHGKECKYGHGTLRYRSNRNCVTCTDTATPRWNAANPEKLRQIWFRSNIKKKFGLTEEAYNQMLAAQGGVCALCGDPPGKRRLAVDHCHTSGAIRALLCANCNHVLGNAKDNAELLRKAADYLDTHSRGNDGDKA
jgi:RNA polymerase-binding transcription factor DksA